MVEVADAPGSVAVLAGSTVYLVCNAPVLGGGERFTLELARALSSTRPVKIVATSGTPVWAAARAAGIDVQSIDVGEKLGRRTALANVASFRESERAFRAFVEGVGESATVVLQYTWEKILWGGGKTDAQVVVLEHGPVPPWIRRVPVLARRLRRALEAGRVVAVSEPASRSALEFAPSASVSVIRGGVDLDRAAAAVARRDELRESLCPAGEPLLVYAGRVTRNKGVLDLVAALERAAQVRLVVVGDGPALPAARGLVRSGRVTFIGSVDDSLPFVAAADALALVSRDPGEGRPLSAVEAWAVGTPVLGSERSQALRDLAAEPGAPLLLVDPDGLDVMAALPELRRLRSSMTRYARSWRDVAADFEGILA